MPHANKILDFLSAAGKISTILLAVTPLPTYIGVWGKSKREQKQRVESISFEYLMLNILCNSIWTSYAFKTQNIDLAISSVVPLLITILLATIYIRVKPESAYIQKFFGVVLISQIFNFDLLSMSTCGLLGTLSSIACNGISLTFIPAVIASRDVSLINQPLTIVSCINSVFWFLYAWEKNEPFMLMSNSLGVIFNCVQLLFYYWAVQAINNRDTPWLMFIMNKLISFFKIFKASDLAQSELVKLFWQDEDSDAAIAYINTYMRDIRSLQ